MNHTKNLVSWSAILLTCVIAFIPASGLAAHGTRSRNFTADTSAPPPFVSVQEDPTVTRQAVPAYPELAREAGIVGNVRVKVWVAKNGEPRKAYVLAFNVRAEDTRARLDDGNGKDGIVISRGFRVPISIFKEPALDAAMRYWFSPAIADGKPVDVWAVVPFVFNQKPGYPRVGQTVNQEKPVAVSYSQSSAVEDTAAPPPDFVPVEKEPQIIKQSLPSYPEEALKDSIQGRIFIKIWIGKTGIPRQAVILRRRLEFAGLRDTVKLSIQGKEAAGFIRDRRVSVDASIFDQPTIAAAMKYRFTPAIYRDKPVSVWVVIPFTYKLAPETEEAGLGPVSPDKLKKELVEVTRVSQSFQVMIERYNDGMYFARKKQYGRALEAYRDFLKRSKEFPNAPKEMVRHAKLMVEKYSKMQGKKK